MPRSQCPDCKHAFIVPFSCAPHGCGSVGESMDGREPTLVTTQNVDPETGGFFETRLPTFAQLRHNWMNRALRLALNTGKLSRKQWGLLS